MNRNNEEKLSLKYANNLLVSGGASGEIFGFECLDGWSGLIDGTLSFVQRYSELQKLDFVVLQVKEKFGLLRIYHQGGDNIIDIVMDMAELVSGGICEQCGKQGRILENCRWLSVRCPAHLDSTATLCHVEPDDEYVRHYASALCALIKLFRMDSIRWAQQECLALGLVRPAEVMNTSKGCRAVYQLIKQIEFGVGV